MALSTDGTIRWRTPVDTGEMQRALVAASPAGVVTSSEPWGSPSCDLPCPPPEGQLYLLSLADGSELLRRPNPEGMRLAATDGERLYVVGAEAVAVRRPDDLTPLGPVMPFSTSSDVLLVSSGLLLVIDEMDQSVVAFGDDPA